ncbi:hypothetical protein [Actinophytocola oryzae]|uniref:hypothetical protein n=1 Tax=Actinophytocola oryzae TaxID=502181 RepID=UPI00106289A2|nr:hypothetical protein [Actinophytocola oryzae]
MACWTRLGGPTHGAMLGGPGAFASPGQVDLFARGSHCILWPPNFVDRAWGGSAWLAVREQDNVVHQDAL